MQCVDDGQYWGRPYLQCVDDRMKMTVKIWKGRIWNVLITVRIGRPYLQYVYDKSVLSKAIYKMC